MFFSWVSLLNIMQTVIIFSKLLQILLSDKKNRKVFLNFYVFIIISCFTIILNIMPTVIIFSKLLQISLSDNREEKKNN
jgi:chromate transport protein ChrA